VQRDVGAAPGVAGRGEVVGVDLAFNLVDLDLDRIGHTLALGEPLGVGPGLEDLGGSGVLAGSGQLGDFVERVIDQHDAGQGTGGLVGQLLVLQCCYQRGHIVAADHGAQHTDGSYRVDQGGLLLAADDLGQELGLDLGGRVNTRGDAVGDQVQQELFLALGGLDQQFGQVGGLLGGQRQRRDTLLGAFFLVLQIGFDHRCSSLVVWSIRPDVLAG